MAFHEVPIESLEFNPFKKISKQWMLITAGDEKKSNTMTASWGGLGIMWGKNVATGRVERGTLHLNDELEILGVKEDVLKTVVTGIEMFRKQLDEAMAGDNIGALLRGVNRDQIVRGQVLAKPGTVTCHHKFTAQVYVLTKDEGGRHTPFFNNYRPQFYFSR